MELGASQNTDTSAPELKEVVVQDENSGGSDGGVRQRPQRNRRNPDWYGTRLPVFREFHQITPQTRDWRCSGAAKIWTPW